MTLASIERRLSKIEAGRRPPKGLFYIAWGRTADEIEASLEQARSAGTITDGDPVVRCAWPVGPVLPLARWALDAMDTFSHIEFGALMGEVDRLRDDMIAGLRAEMHERGAPQPPKPVGEPPPRRRDDIAKGMHDAALLATVLAIPLNGERASLTEDRMDRVARYIVQLGLRASIRGSDWHLEQAVENAFRGTKH